MTSATRGPLNVTWLGQAGFCYHFPRGVRVCTDPYLSHAASGGKTRERLALIPIPAWQLEADLVILTHDHSDHFDEVTLRAAAQARPSLFIGPSSCREHWLAMNLPAERFLRLDQGETLEVAGVTLRATYAKHRSGQSEDAIGVVLEADGWRIYQVGDSEHDARLADTTRALHPDLMTVPINGRLGNMDHTQAAQLTHTVEPRVVVPMHYGMFANNSADPQTFVDACRDTGAAARVMVMTVGRRVSLETPTTP